LKAQIACSTANAAFAGHAISNLKTLYCLSNFDHISCPFMTGYDGQGGTSIAVNAQLLAKDLYIAMADPYFSHPH
jgi:hypothetical protein